MVVQWYILSGLVVWVLLLTLSVGWIVNSFRRLSKGVEKENLIKVLEHVLAKQEDVSKSLTEVKKQVSEFESRGQLHIQKIGVVRFNPFKEMGGDHSFSLALLDGNNTGFVITGLHTRERTRVYLKDVMKGKSNLELSNEEKKALTLAQKK
ncbi:hypothetical protein A2Z67_01880 [Candidatus Woesebacteria bacterium RBG_13_36_22]|uniref:DUF4446 domain-containing protein n=1 Tax=Candidatus Woesebacteria bacterium RBG_13_36_22 TaxID=1802478 RepID=A0A1F7X226_9BACT|nr:MAG: hypothetical protein A2Z67_01880 [Candidatus Woesebacteria bacterium RBG_13_36_22]